VLSGFPYPQLLGVESARKGIGGFPVAGHTVNGREERLMIHQEEKI